MAADSLERYDYSRLFKARELRRRGSPKEAIEPLQQVVEQHSAFYLGWFNLALALDAIGDSGAAADAYQRAMQLEPDQAERDASIYNTYGHFLCRNQQHQEALALFDRALAINPA
ncbi:MAG: hypothetical protein CME06_01680, partial [Gemmatimonadetes bacterium]|nr:hypothetical protein [Gemmatimonadota bacterium]